MNTLEADQVQSGLKDGVGRIVLNRPDKRNALTREIIERLSQEVDQLAKQPELRVLVFEATGKVFCAGMDLGEMQLRATSPNSAEDWQKDSEVLCNLLTTIFSLPVPTVAVVQGPVLAGGMGFVLACDMIIASENTFFALPEPMRGITAAMVTPLLTHRIGYGPATYMLLSGERVSAHKAAAFGLCHDVVTREDLAERSQVLVSSILSGSKSALAITKKHINDCCANDVVAQVNQSIDVSAEARATDDAREGLAAFLEKRKPNWQD